MTESGPGGGLRDSSLEPLIFESQIFESQIFESLMRPPQSEPA